MEVGFGANHCSNLLEGLAKRPDRTEVQHDGVNILPQRALHTADDDSV